MKDTKKEERNEAIVETLSKTELFFKNNGRKLIIATVAVLVIVAAWVLWYKFSYQPKKEEAQEQMYPAEANFRTEEYELALRGDGNVLGFEQIIDDYGKKAGKSAYFYAGVCELQLGNYSEAISYLKKYKGKDQILSGRALCCIGDAYVGLNDYKTAISWFEKAAKTSDDVFSAGYLLKAGVASEEIGNNEQALGYYNEIKLKYPQSMEGYDIDKYISRIEAKTK